MDDEDNGPKSFHEIGLSFVQALDGLTAGQINAFGSIINSKANLGRRVSNKLSTAFHEAVLAKKKLKSDILKTKFASAEEVAESMAALGSTKRSTFGSILHGKRNFARRVSTNFLEGIRAVGRGKANFARNFVGLFSNEREEHGHHGSCGPIGTC